MTIQDVHGMDGHAPFPHYLIVIPPSTVRKRDPLTRKIVAVEKPGQEFVVCYFCKHWVNRPTPRCTCRASCHALALAARE